METYKLLLVEDKLSAIDMLRANLVDEPFELFIALDGKAGLEQFKFVKPDIVLLDINLPKLDGVSLCQQIRERSNVPILMVTARTLDVDKAIALGAGADDYLTKPFSPIELIARLKALLRRANRYQERPPEPKILGGPRLQLNPANHRVTLEGAEIHLSPLEYGLLHALLSFPGWVITRSQLIEKVWGHDSEVGEETVTVHIKNLRQKLGPSGSRLIRTVRAVGYLYEEVEGAQ